MWGSFRAARKAQPKLITSGISGNQSLWHWVSASGDKMNLPVIDTIQYNPELQVQFEKWGYLPDKVSINLLNLRVEL
ncbi:MULTISPECIES: hypothetical protein [Cylindrospermopsis]|uniref:Uncharacterized protein n=1 Tax=Cylindrospermopsis curvispora GIHE-G1 TaxID=2666332 RepID=A0A7H0F1H9_9CYAN|nr:MULTISPECIES: hypothetical protein [Cylindrospermopsis]KRH96869.1 hypothetical protein ASL19_15855 [Cylindrospermopsis sp. CR12]MBU6346387.1 hypothetical protein [Cyanobacteria bacterium REEB494]QNP29895.1 hypothetical protein IAR63_01985 [Cylindrospermopsis curvispora GIHE-G1]TPX27624.1 hypothetical protein FIV49_15765 [Cylindrospermopsis raciborskii GIHE 2018]